MKAQAQLEFPLFKGEAMTQLPEDLFIPPEALEIYLEDFSGPMDVLLYLIQKKDIDILELKGSGDIEISGIEFFFPRTLCHLWKWEY